MAVKIGPYEADYHSFHHASLGTDLSVIRHQATKRTERGNNKPTPATVIHFHRADETCAEAFHETFGGTIVQKAA